MASKKECDQYASEVTRRFEEFTQWAIQHWPNQDLRLMKSDFNQARQELSRILGPRLSESCTDEADAMPARESARYVALRPTPWP
jgi:hypothetical protein